MAKKNNTKITEEAVRKRSAPIKKKASLLSKMHRFLPKSKTLENAATKQLIKAQDAGRTIRRDKIRGDMDIAKAKTNLKDSGKVDTGDVNKSKDLSKANDDLSKKNQGLQKRNTDLKDSIEALKGGNRNMYMLAGGAGLAGGGAAGYALGNSGSNNRNA